MKPVPAETRENSRVGYVFGLPDPKRHVADNKRVHAGPGETAFARMCGSYCAKSEAILTAADEPFNGINDSSARQTRTQPMRLTSNALAHWAPLSSLLHDVRT